MAGFGFLLGDIALVTQCAWKVCRSVKAVGPEFQQMMLDDRLDYNAATFRG